MRHPDCETALCAPMAIEPANQPLIKLGGIGGDCAAVIGVVYLPQYDRRIAGCDQPGMARGDVAVALPMNQKHGNRGCGHSVFRRDLFEVQLVLSLGVSECELDNWAQRSPSEPCASAEALADAVVADFAKARER